MSQDITQLLLDWNNGNKQALDQLVPFVYNQLHELATKRLSQERANHTLQPTALVNEAYLRLIKWESVNWQDRVHFFAVAALIMRNILVDHARKQLADKRAGPKNRISLEDATDQIETREWDLIALDDALRDFASIDPRQSQIIELRFLEGLP